MSSTHKKGRQEDTVREMLIYQDWHKSTAPLHPPDSLQEDLKQSTSGSDNNTYQRSKSLLTRNNTNFLRNLGYRVRQYQKKKIKNE